MGQALTGYLKYPVFSPPRNEAEPPRHLRLLAVEEGVFSHPDDDTIQHIEYQLDGTVPAAMSYQIPLELGCVIDWHISLRKGECRSADFLQWGAMRRPAIWSAH